MGVIKAATAGALDSIKSPWKVVKSLGKGDLSGAWKNLKAIPGNQERANSKTLNKLGIRGWVGDHPTASAAMVAATIFSGGSLLSGMGSGGGAAGGAAGAGTSTASAGGGGLGMLGNLGSLFGGGGGAGGAAGGASSGGGIMGGISSFMGGSTGGMSNSGLLSMGFNILGSISNYINAGETAKAMKKAQEEQWRQQLIATRESYASLANAERATAKQYHSEFLENQVSLLQQRAQVALLAGASGTGGNSITSMLNDLAGQGGRNQATIIDNYETQQLNFASQLKAIQMGGQMTMRSFSKPSAFGSLLQGVTGAADAYMSGSQKGAAFSKAWSDSRTYSSGIRGVN